jgi:predicted transcriptional regulator of viral defense system
LNVCADISYYFEVSRTKDSAVEGLPGFVRAIDLEARGLSRSVLRGMVRRGEIERIDRGLYRRTDAPITELETVATVAKQIPGGVICLLTALSVHGIGTQLPFQVWIALDRKARKTARQKPRLRVVRFSSAMLRHGVETRDVLGVPVQITSPARTVIDCFRYRNKIGLDVAVEALRDVVSSRTATIGELARMAEACRIRTVIGPYLEAMVQ